MGRGVWFSFAYLLKRIPLFYKKKIDTYLIILFLDLYLFYSFKVYSFKAYFIIFFCYSLKMEVFFIF